MKYHIDFETRSVIDLKKCGLDVYAKDPSTEILCMAYAYGDEEPEIWYPGLPFPIDLAIHIEEGGEVHAHNAPFEFAIWNEVGVKKLGWPELKIEQVYCNMAAALAMALPGSLEKLAIALNLDVQKDMQGNRVMMQLSKPRRYEDVYFEREDGRIDYQYGPVWWEKKDVPEKFEALYKYCIDDVIVERASGKHMRRLSEQERKIWLLDHKINQRGVKIDIESVKLAEQMILEEKERLDAEMRKITNFEVASCSSAAQIRDFLNSTGLEMDGVTKGEILDTLLLPELTEVQRQVLTLRQEAAKSSTAKLTAMSGRAHSDGRVRYLAQYHGAGTGRWAGRGIQVQNLPRPKIKQKEIESIIANLHQGAEYIDIIHGPVTTLISDCLRGFITAEDGKNLIANDWSNIEGRALSWLADETWKIKAFNDFDKGIGADIYKLSYSASFHLSLEKVEDQHRQIGKVLELSMGYGGGVGAFQSMATNYGVKVTDERADELKVAWRNAHPKIVAYWRQLENAAILAVKNPGKTFTAGPNDHREIKYKMDGSFLACRLPSTRCLYYPSPSIKQKETPWGEMRDSLTYMSEDSLTKRWVRTHFYGGLAAENITQAVARDILAESLLRLEDNNYPIVMHVHDEAVAETDINDKTKNHKHMSELMCVLPTWAIGLPIAAAGWTGKIYRK